MKIIGKTDTGYLVEASLAELVQVSGESWVNKAGFVQQTQSSSGYGRDAHIPLGTIIEVSPRFKRLEELEAARDRVLGSISSLRGLADLLDKAIPPGLAIPAKPKPEPKDDAL